MQQVQTIKLNVLEAATGPPTTPTAPTTGAFNSYLDSVSHWNSSNWLAILAISAIIILGILALVFYCTRRRAMGKTYLLSIFIPVIVLAGCLGTTNALATSTLTLSQPEYDLSINMNTISSLSKNLDSATIVNSDNPTGYNLTARLQNPLMDGATLALNNQPLTTSDIDIYTAHTADPSSKYDHTLTITIPQDLQKGQYSFDIVYSVTENPPPIQGMTALTCATLPAYPAADSTMLMRDVRNHQDYQIRKLPDGNCWMVSNLKIENFTTTNIDTDLNTITSFAIPTMTQSAADASYDSPRIYGPLTSDVTSNGQNYDVSAPDSDHFGGYFYNWPAATAGETTATMPGGSDVAPNSICPKGWRLPTGDPSGEFVQLDNIISVAGWQFSGAFRGVFAGDWDNGFSSQGDYGLFWSSSERPLTSNVAYTLYLDDFFPFVGGTSNRDDGMSIRCLAR
jgi:uncharacterized protein (TIGR02145 family)